MKYARIGKNRILVEVPTDYAEGLKMLTAAMNGYYNKRGGNLARQSAAARVAYGLFGARSMAADPTIALIYLLQEICRRKGAGLDALEKPRKWSAAEEEEKQT
jgi:hypothetical protein